MEQKEKTWQERFEGNFRIDCDWADFNKVLKESDRPFRDRLAGFIAQEITAAEARGQAEEQKRIMEVVDRHWHKVYSSSEENGVVLEKGWNDAMRYVSQAIGHKHD